MKIVKLSAKNVKRLRAVEITPDGNLVVVSGKNGQGKSSLLDAIEYALAGKSAICREPIRRGEKRAEVVCDLGDLVVRRTFTEDGGGQLTLETKDGARFKEPQGRLDDLIGQLSFDPLEFSRMKPAAQAETLRALVGLDLSKLDGERDVVFAKRTEVNRDGKALAARFEALPPVHEGVPSAEQSTAEILERQEAAQRKNSENAIARGLVEIGRAELDAAEHRGKAVASRLTELQNEIDRLLARQQELVQEGLDCVSAVEAARAMLHQRQLDANELKDVDLSPFREQLAGVEAANRKVRENAARAQLEGELEERRYTSKKLTEHLDDIATRREKEIAAAAFPVPGLGFDAHGFVTLNGLPFDQASAAEQLRVSVAMGLALNPKLRVLLIRDGSLLDEESLRLVGELAAEADAQLWLERVEEGGATVVIEDGSVVTPAPAEAEAEAAS